MSKVIFKKSYYRGVDIYMIRSPS